MATYGQAARKRWASCYYAYRAGWVARATGAGFACPYRADIPKLAWFDGWKEHANCTRVEKESLICPI